jgi:hypothetical protein
MGKIVGLAVIAVLVASGAYAAVLDSGKSAPAAAQSVSASAAAQGLATNGAATSDLLAQKKEAFNDTQWAVTETPMNAQGQQAKQDTLTFIDGQMISQNAQQAGYSASNFSVRLLADGTFVWETMQTSKAGTIFWRGDIGADGTMRGIMSSHDLKSNVSNSSFLSVSGKKITPPKPAATAAK